MRVFLKNKTIFTIEAFTYIGLMALAFTPQIGSIIIPQNLQKIIAILIFLYIIGIFLLHKKRNPNIKKIRTLFMLYLIPALIIHLYSIVLVLIGRIDNGFLNMNLSAYAPILTAISSIYLFNDKALKYNLISIIIAWSISIFGAFIANGIGIIPYAIQQGFFNNPTPVLGVTKNYFELSDIVLSTGLPLIYYIYSKSKPTKNTALAILILIIIGLMGIKRIAVAGIVASLLYVFIVKHTSNIAKLYLSFIVRCLLFAISFSYVYLIFNDELNILLSNINMMGRNYYYDAIKQYGHFSPKYLGLGRNSVSLIFTHKLKYLKVGGVHSDILKMYMENGFFLFLAWLWYYLFCIPRKIKKVFNTETFHLYTALIIYTFIIYLTDNVENYFIYQNFFIIIPYCYFLSSRKGATK